MTEKESDSSLSHSACQIVLEKKAERLKAKRSRLADPCLSHNDNSNKSTKSLFPIEPHRRGMDNQETQILPLKKQATDFSNVVTQGLPWEEFHPRFFMEKPAATATAEANKLGNHGSKGNPGGRRTTRKNDESRRRKQQNPNSLLGNAELCACLLYTSPSPRD